MRTSLSAPFTTALTRAIKRNSAGDHGHSHGGAAKKLPTTWDYISLQLFHPAVQGPNLKLLMNASLFAASIYVSHHFGYLLAQ